MLKAFRRGTAHELARMDWQMGRCISPVFRRKPLAHSARRRAKEIRRLTSRVPRLAQQTDPEVSLRNKRMPLFSTMTATVANLVKQAMSLPNDSRTELVEAILAEAKPSQEFLADQMKVVRQRMDNVREGRSELIPAEEAHRRVREALSQKR